MCSKFIHFGLYNIFETSMCFYINDVSDNNHWIYVWYMEPVSKQRSWLHTHHMIISYWTWLFVKTMRNTNTLRSNWGNQCNFEFCFEENVHSFQWTWVSRFYDFDSNRFFSNKKFASLTECYVRIQFSRRILSFTPNDKNYFFSYTNTTQSFYFHVTSTQIDRSVWIHSRISTQCVLLSNVHTY